MAKWIEQGGLKSPVTDYPVPEGGLTRAAIRDKLGPPVVAYPTPNGGTLFARQPSPALVGTFRPNMRASFLCGWLIYGPAIHALPGDKILWHEPTKEAAGN